MASLSGPLGGLGGGLWGEGRDFKSLALPLKNFRILRNTRFLFSGFSPPVSSEGTRMGTRETLSFLNLYRQPMVLIRYYDRRKFSRRVFGKHVFPRQPPFRQPGFQENLPQSEGQLQDQGLATHSLKTFGKARAH